MGLLGLSLILVVLAKPPVYPSDFFRRSAKADDVEWSQYAYCQYVATEAYLCNSLMTPDSLSQTGSQASKIMLYSHDWDTESHDIIGHLLRKAKNEYDVQLSPIEIQHFAGEATWSDSFTKPLAFNLMQFQRVISLDSDATLLQNMDELFLLPSTPVAMPRAYWLEDTVLSQLIVIEPSKFEFQCVQDAIAHRNSDDLNMEIVNDLYAKDCMILPHRRYDLLTGEFRAENHSKYLGSMEEAWDSELVLEEAKFEHFSVWSLPKPRLDHPRDQEESARPKCHVTADGEDCRDRDIWLALCQDFSNRREVDSPLRLCF